MRFLSSVNIFQCGISDMVIAMLLNRFYIKCEGQRQTLDFLDDKPGSTAKKNPHQRYVAGDFIKTYLNITVRILLLVFQKQNATFRLVIFSDFNLWSFGNCLKCLGCLNRWKCLVELLKLD